VAETSDERWTIGRLLNWTTGYLREHGSESPRLDTEVLLAHAVGCERIKLYARFDDLAPEAAREKFRDLVRRRSQGAPVAHLVGHKEFFSLDFEVGPDVLIPRPDSEFVVLEFLRIAKPMTQLTAIDIGTGSGNLAIAAAHQHPGVRFWAIDRSRAALEMARRNAERHGVSDRIEFLEGSLFDPLPANLQVDCILSNPPYIPTGEIPNLAVGVREYEPYSALDGGPTGLEVVTAIVRQADRFLKPGGQLILEIGAPQELAVRSLIGDRGQFKLLDTIRDYAGHARVISGIRSES
jgi:release factor glutamine methyltransferase